MNYFILKKKLLSKENVFKPKWYIYIYIYINRYLLAKKGKKVVIDFSTNATHLKSKGTLWRTSPNPF